MAASVRLVQLATSSIFQGTQLGDVRQDGVGDAKNRPRGSIAQNNKLFAAADLHLATDREHPRRRLAVIASREPDTADTPVRRRCLRVHRLRDVAEWITDTSVRITLRNTDMAAPNGPATPL